jgi:hypothetical protein
MIRNVIRDVAGFTPYGEVFLVAIQKDFVTCAGVRACVRVCWALNVKQRSV